MLFLRTLIFLKLCLISNKSKGNTFATQLSYILINPSLPLPNQCDCSVTSSSSSSILEVAGYTALGCSLYQAGVCCASA